MIELTTLIENAHWKHAFKDPCKLRETANARFENCTEVSTCSESAAT